VLQSEFVLKHGKIHGNQVMAYETPFVQGVDSEVDFDYLNYQIARDQTLVDRLFHT
jgi:hypothetical protein